MTLIDLDDLMVVRRTDVADQTMINVGGGMSVGVGRAGSDDYWAYRVQLTDQQALIGFPKFGTIGVGFLVEEDWNSNLPYASRVSMVADHIGHNRFVDGVDIPRPHVERAIALIRDAAGEDRDGAYCVDCRAASRDDPAVAFDHWPDDCPRPADGYNARRLAEYDARRGPDGWPVPEPDDEDE